MAKYRKKPVVIEAIQYNGDNLDECVLFIGKTPSPKFKNLPAIYIHTLEGVMKANMGDFIIKGINGEFYPCKSDIFEKTYEKVED